MVIEGGGIEGKLKGGKMILLCVPQILGLLHLCSSCFRGEGRGERHGFDCLMPFAK